MERNLKVIYTNWDVLNNVEHAGFKKSYFKKYLKKYKRSDQEIFVHATYIFEEVPKKAIELAKQDSNFYILLDDSMEGYAYYGFDRAFKFVLEHNLKNKVIYSTGLQDAETEYQAWLEQKNKEKLFYVWTHQSWYYRHADWVIDLEKNPKVDKNQYFICMNNRPRHHRLVSGVYMDYLNLLDKGIVSLNEQNYEDPGTSTFESMLLPHLNLYKDNYAEIIKNQWKITQPKLPLIVDNKNLHDKCMPSDLNPDLYDNTLINLVTETYYHFQYNKVSNLFITEKTWKPFTAYQIPVIIGPKGEVDYLRCIGFDMFDDIIDHSYDSEPDSTRVFGAINALKETIEKYDVEELSKITKERRIKNRELYLSYLPIDKPITEILC